MQREQPDLHGARVDSDGRLINSAGQPTGWHAPDGGREIVDERGRVVGTITRTGRVYDRYGRFVAEIVRRDIRT